jgi:transcription elongation GreA/GreB family factor
MNKEKLINQIVAHLKAELNNSEQAAKNAHLAATDDQSVAETQYDTLAIESAYLAEGQSRRIIEFKKALKAFEQLTIDDNCKHVVLGSLVQLNEDQAENHWFFIAPAAAGFRAKIDEQHYTVITPQSPMGQALLGKQLDDEISIRLGHSELNDDIVAIN